MISAPPLPIMYNICTYNKTELDVLVKVLFLSFFTFLIYSSKVGDEFTVLCMHYNIHMNENPSLRLRHPNSRKVHRKRTGGLVMPLPAGQDLQTKDFGNSPIEKYQKYYQS